MPTISKNWEETGYYRTERMPVPGGWLYRNDIRDSTMCFVPEPKGEKVIQSEQFDREDALNAMYTRGWEECKTFFFSEEGNYASPKWMVICRDDSARIDGEYVPGDYVAATHKLFNDNNQAALYAATVNASREPIVVELLKPLYEV